MTVSNKSASDRLVLTKSHSLSLSVRVENRLHQDIIQVPDLCWLTIRPVNYLVGVVDSDATVSAVGTQVATPNGKVFRVDVQAEDLNIDAEEEYFFDITYVRDGYSISVLSGPCEIVANVTNRGAGSSFVGTNGVFEAVATVEDRVLLTVTSSMPIPEKGDPGKGIYITSSPLAAVIGDSISVTATTIESLGREVQLGDLLLSEATNEWVAAVTARSFTGPTLTSVTATTKMAIQGPQGDIGPVGPIGPPGLSSAAASTDAGNVLVAGTDGKMLLTEAMINAAFPAGTVQMWAGSAGTPPLGWLICDGSVFNPATYPDLYAVIGTQFGGSGPAPLLPNLKGRVPVGNDLSDASFNVVGETGGAKTHSLTVAELASHTHLQDPHTHLQQSHNHLQNAHTHGNTPHAHGPGNLHGYSESRTDDTSGAAVSGPLNYAYNDYNMIEDVWITSGNTSAASVAITGATAVNQGAVAVNQNATAVNQNTGSGTGHNNLQPYIVLNYIIKAV